MDIIYVVTSGEHDDYRICGLFDSKELAQLFIKLFPDNRGDEFIIEEHEVNPFKNEIKNGYFAFFVRMKKDGTCTNIEKADSAYGYIGECQDGFSIHGSMFCHVFAKDEKHAIEITNKKRAELIALNKWNTVL